MSKKSIFKKYKLYFQESGHDTPFFAGYETLQDIPELDYDPYLDSFYSKDL